MTRSEAISPEDCRRQLARILASDDFDTTARGRKFLSYVVNETLAGNADRIKAYSIALEVFDRDDAFDPHNDPIVRVAAGHLRRSLERYYLMEGSSDPVLISIPKGGYVPVFSLHEAIPNTQSSLPIEGDPSREISRKYMPWLPISGAIAVLASIIAAISWWNINSSPNSPDLPWLLVERLENLGEVENSAAMAIGLTHEIVNHLSKFSDVIVVESTENASALPRYVLGGNFYLSETRFRLQAKLVNRADGAVLWAHTFDRPVELAELLDAQSEIAGSIAEILADTSGVIVQSDIVSAGSDASGNWDAYACTLSYYVYRQALDARERAEIRTCLERSVARFPSYATAWALLAQIEYDEVRFTFDRDAVKANSALAHALEKARRAVALDPRNLRALRSEMAILFFMGETEAAIAVGEKALVINPNDVDFMAQLGIRLALSGNWKRGCDLVDRARKRMFGSTAYLEPSLALCAFFRLNDYQLAAEWIAKTPAHGNATYHLIAAALFAEAGRMAEAERERLWLEDNQPDLVQNMRQEVRQRLGNEADSERFIEGLRKAGFEVPQ